MTLAMPVIAHRSTRSTRTSSHVRTESCLRAVLDRTSRQLGSADVSSMDDFVDELNRVRLSVAPTEWARLVTDVLAVHPILEQLHEEPFTRRAFEKPRGYAGDAVMMDMVYRDRPYEGALTTLGAALYAWIDCRPAAVSVRERRARLAAEIDAIAERYAAPRVLSIACGHVREAQVSRAMRRGAISELVALDQDGESLSVVEREQSELNVRVQRASVRRFVRTGSELGQFELVYSAGLYDYLNDADAKAVTEAMFRSVRPGGRLLIANLTPDLPDIGLLEAFMDWRLIYRDDEALARLADGIPAWEVAARSITRDRLGNVAYLTIDRAGT
jgi:SAM-dependent methyltransferase